MCYYEVTIARLIDTFNVTAVSFFVIAFAFWASTSWFSVCALLRLFISTRKTSMLLQLLIALWIFNIAFQWRKPHSAERSSTSKVAKPLTPL